MLYLVTGGSGSGKSEYAENLAAALKKRHTGGSLYYVATMYPYDEESHRRIARHRLMRRDKGFETKEHYCRVSDIEAGENDVLLLECMSNLLANEMYLEEGSIRARDKSAKKQLQQAVIEPLLALAKQAGDLVVVTNEVFSDGGQYDAECEKYIELLGTINAALAKEAKGVAEVVCTIPIPHKGTFPI